MQYFGYGQDHSEKVVDLIEYIQQETCQLASNYSMLPLIYTENYKDDANVDLLIKKYAESSEDFQITETPIYEKILHSPEPEPLILQLTQWRAFLRADCFVIACFEAKKAISEILDECKKLATLLADYQTTESQI